jgi:hypothetical protein
MGSIALPQDKNLKEARYDFVKKLQVCFPLINIDLSDLPSNLVEETPAYRVYRVNAAIIS